MGTGTRWNHRETIALIRLWRTDRVQQLMDGSTRNARAYEILSEDLRKLGFLRSSSQVKERMKRLKREYRQILLQASQQGLNPAHWPYYHLVRPIVEQAFTAGGLRASLEGPEEVSMMDEAAGIPYVITKPDISAYEIEQSPSPNPSQHDGSVDGMEAGAGVLDNYQMAQDISQFHSAFGDAADRVGSDMLSLQDVGVEMNEQDVHEPLDVKPQILMEPSSSSSKTGGNAKKKFKKNLMKDIFETVKAAQMEACAKMTETFQEMEEKRMQLEVELEERRMASEKEMMQTFLSTMQSSMNQMVKNMRKPCACHCNSKNNDESKE